MMRGTLRVITNDESWGVLSGLITNDEWWGVLSGFITNDEWWGELSGLITNDEWWGVLSGLITNDEWWGVLSGFIINQSFSRKRLGKRCNCIYRNRAQTNTKLIQSSNKNLYNIHHRRNNNNTTIINFIETRLQDTIGKILKYRWLG